MNRILLHIVLAAGALSGAVSAQGQPITRADDGLYRFWDGEKPLRRLVYELTHLTGGPWTAADGARGKLTLKQAAVEESDLVDHVRALLPRGMILTRVGEGDEAVHVVATERAPEKSAPPGPAPHDVVGAPDADFRVVEIRGIRALDLLEMTTALTNASIGFFSSDIERMVIRAAPAARIHKSKLLDHLVSLFEMSPRLETVDLTLSDGTTVTGIYRQSRAKHFRNPRLVSRQGFASDEIKGPLALELTTKLRSDLLAAALSARAGRKRVGVLAARGTRRVVLFGLRADLEPLVRWVDRNVR